MQPTFDATTVVVCRDTIPCEIYCGHLIKSVFQDVNVIHTRAITKMGEEMLGTLKDKNVIIYGGYYRHSHKEILNVAKSVCCIVQNERLQNWDPHVFLFHDFACAWTIDRIRKMVSFDGCITDKQVKIGDMLDEYMYNYPGEEAMNFQNGLYLIDAPNDLEKLKRVETEDKIAHCIEEGRKKRLNNFMLAQERVKKAILLTKKIGGEHITMLISEGDSPIVDTCNALAKASPSGIGALVRHDYHLERTYVSICATRDSGMEASTIARDWVNGGGSKFMGGGSIDGLAFPRDL